MTKLYKYLSPDILDHATSRKDHVSVKCSYPKDYNDPYELSLAIDIEEDSSLLAFYLDTVEQISQRPTSCFSKSPIVTPMWAHYANNASGFVIEFDETKLKETITDLAINDIQYMDAPSPDISSWLHMAFGTCKPRHTMQFYNCVNYYAYFSKQSCWAYEQERRMVLDESHITSIAGNMLLFIPKECVSAIIVGPKAEPNMIKKCLDITNNLGCNNYRMVIGKSAVTPFFMDKNENTLIFDGKEIIPSENTCENCLAPISIEQEKCSWCKIDRDDFHEAARRNPLRMLASMGALDDYIESFSRIGENK